MASNLDKYKQDLEQLLQRGEAMLFDFAEEAEGKKPEAKIPEPGAEFRNGYQRWYSEAHEVVKQILPSRLPEFEQLYKGDGKRKELNVATYTIQDWLLGVRSAVNYREEKIFNEIASALMRFQNQVQILKSTRSRFESTLFEIKQILQADIFDSELEAARELCKKGFLRAAGAVAGVVLEKHLAQVCGNHNIAVKKKDPTIGDLNDALKNSGVMDVPDWRFIQRLGDLRNLCDHNKQREPKKEEVEELVAGVEKVTKTLF